MGVAASCSNLKAAKQLGLKLRDFDVFESNEVFAASGARITMFAMKQLEKTGGRYGSISSCCGGGQGSTAIIENLRR